MKVRTVFATAKEVAVHSYSGNFVCFVRHVISTFMVPCCGTNESFTYEKPTNGILRLGLELKIDALILPL